MRERRSYNVAPALGAGAAATAGLGVLAAAASDVRWSYPLQSAVMFAGFMAVLVWTAGHEHPFPRFGRANHVTTARVVITALLAGLVGQAPVSSLLWPAVGSVAVAALLDGADGWLARRSGMASVFGARFDMETDAAIIFVLSVLVWQHDKAGAWVLLCGLMRYAFVVAGCFTPWLARPLRSTRRGKAVAIAQYVGLSIALAPAVAPAVSGPVAIVTLAALCWSFAVDVLWLWRVAEVSTS